MNFASYENMEDIMTAVKAAIGAAGGGGSMQVIGLDTLTSLQAGDIVVLGSDYAFSGGANFISVDKVELKGSGVTVTNYGSAAPTLKSITPIIVTTNTAYVNSRNNVIFEQMGEYYSTPCEVSLMYDEFQGGWSISLSSLRTGVRPEYMADGLTLWYTIFGNLNTSGLQIASRFKVLRVG